MSRSKPGGPHPGTGISQRGGCGVVLYFDLVKYLGVLMFCFSALHLVAIYFNSAADVEILEGDAHNWGGAGEDDFSLREDVLGLDLS